MPKLSDSMFLASVKGSPSRRTLNLSANPMTLLVFTANKHSQISSRYYHDRLGLRAMDYRILIILTAEPNSSVTNASSILGIDKAAVSRSLRRLKVRRYVTSKTPGSNPRHLLWRLTEKGNALHDKILKISLVRQRQYLKGLGAEDIKRLSGMLRLILKNLEAVEAADLN